MKIYNEYSCCSISFFEKNRVIPSNNSTEDLIKNKIASIFDHATSHSSIVLHSKEEFISLGIYAFDRPLDATNRLKNYFGLDKEFRYEKIVMLISLIINNTNFTIQSVLNMFESKKISISEFYDFCVGISDKINDHNSSELIKCILKTIKRYEQLTNKVFSAPWFEHQEKSRPSAFEIFQIARFIEEELPSQLRGRSEKFLKMRDTKLVRMLQLERKNKKISVVIIASSQNSIFGPEVSGSVKKFRSAARIELNDCEAEPVPVVRGCNHLDRSSPSHIIAFRRELHLGIQLAEQNDCFVRPITWDEYTVKYRDKNKKCFLIAQRISAIYEYCTGDVFTLRWKRNLARNERLLVAKGIVDAVFVMQKLGYVHLDLKLENILYQSLKDGTKKIKLADFGFSEKIQINKPIRFLQTQFGSIFYGATSSTAPELFCNPLFQEHVLQKQENQRESYLQIDLFALGKSLFELMSSNPDLPHLKIVTDAYMSIVNNQELIQQPEVLEEYRRQYAAQLLKDIAEAIGTDDPMDRLIREMLVIDPMHRIRIEQVKERLDSIVENISHVA